MSITPGDIRAKTFPMTADGGYEGGDVRAYMDMVASQLESASGSASSDFIGAMKEDAKAIVSDARSEADEIRQRARREALALLEASRRDAEDLIRAAQDEYEKLRSRATGMRSRIRETEAALNSLAIEALPKLDAISNDMTRPQQRETVDVTVVPDAVVGLDVLQDMSSADLDFDAAVELLLQQFGDLDAAGVGQLAAIV